MNIPFTPASTVGLSVTVASNRVPLPLTGPGARTIMVTSENGVDMAFIALGDATVVALPSSGLPQANSYPILPGSKEPITVGPLTTHVAAITATGTAMLYFTSGDGV